MTSEKKAKSETTFEQDLESLESIVNALEEGKLPLDAALRQFETGVGLVRKCEKTLRDAERKIEQLVRGMDGELEPQPFDEEAAEAPVEAQKTPQAPKSAPRRPQSAAPPPEHDIPEPPPDEDDLDELF